MVLLGKAPSWDGWEETPEDEKHPSPTFQLLMLLGHDLQCYSSMREAGKAGSVEKMLPPREMSTGFFFLFYFFNM